ncbi:MAG TPA: kelch repeat-containing protein [Acidimicrobiales bacterium]|nr:kelch repeat-containing protein [Acidimicrobiales bacterium]
MALVAAVITATTAPALGRDSSPPPVGAWKTIPARTRSYHTATLLRDGTVLVAGGCVGADVLRRACGQVSLFGLAIGDQRTTNPSAEAQIFDSRDRTWRATGPMIQARAGHTATLLPDGKVLALGGFTAPSGRGVPADHLAELYDPATRRWSLASPPLRAAELSPPNGTGFAHTATVLNGSPAACALLCGKVLVAGPGVAQLYDPIANAWTEAPPPPAIDRPAAVRFGGGRVFVTGGERGGSAVFDPAGGAWHEAASAPVKVTFQAVAALHDGRVLVSGGTDLARETADSLVRVFHGPIAGAELFEMGAAEGSTETSAQGAWKPVPPLAGPRFSHTATVLKDGKVLVVGGVAAGERQPARRLATAELYDPGTGRWQQAGRMGHARGGYYAVALSTVTSNTPAHTATLLRDGRVLVVGGAGPTADIYTPGGAGGDGGPTRRIAVAATAGGLLVLLVLLGVIAARRRRSS